MDADTLDSNISTFFSHSPSTWKYRRFVSTLDKRHLSLKSAPRSQPDWEGTLLDPDVLQSRLLHPSVVPTDLPIARQSAEVSTDQIRRLLVEPLPRRAEIPRCRRLADLARGNTPAWMTSSLRAFGLHHILMLQAMACFSTAS